MYLACQFLVMCVCLDCCDFICSDGVMDQLERFLVISSSGDVTSALDFHTLDTLGPEARTKYLGNALQKVLQQYTNAAASFISDMLTFISRFAIQVRRMFCIIFRGGWNSLVIWMLKSQYFCKDGVQFHDDQKANLRKVCLIGWKF